MPAVSRLDRTRLRRQRRRATLLAALVGLLVLVLGGTGIAVWRIAAADDAAPAGPAPTASGPRAGPASFTHASAAAAAMAAARSAVQVVDSYDYRVLDQARTASLAVSTGHFAMKVAESFAGELASTAAQQRTVQVCHVQAVALRGLSMGADGTPSGAELLVFAALAVTDVKATTQPRVSTVELAVSMAHLGGQWLLSDMAALGGAALPAVGNPGSPGLAVAVQTAGTAVVNLFSLRRAQFAADARRALTALAPTLAAAQRANQGEIRDAMTSGKFDLSAQLLNAAAERADGDSASALVAVRAYREPDSGAPQLASLGRYRVTLQRVDDRWLVSGFAAVEGS